MISGEDYINEDLLVTTLIQRLFLLDCLPYSGQCHCCKVTDDAVHSALLSLVIKKYPLYSH